MPPIVQARYYVSRAFPSGHNKHAVLHVPFGSRLILLVRVYVVFIRHFCISITLKNAVLCKDIIYKSCFK